MAACRECGGALVIDARGGDHACNCCGLVEGGSLTVVECGHDFFHEGEPLLESGYEPPPHLPPCKVPWFSPEGWSPNNLPALCQKGPPSSGSICNPARPPGQELRRVGKKVLEEYAQVNQLIDLLGLPSPVADTARSYLTTCLSKRLQRGAARQGTLVAAVFHACRAHSASRTARELSKVSGVPPSAIKQACKRTAPFIEERSRASGGLRDLRPEDLMARCCGALMAGREPNESKRLLILCKQRCASRDRFTVLQGKTPSTVAAVVIWKVVQEERIPIKRREISLNCGISLGTLTKAINEFERQAEEQPARMELDLNL